MFAPPPPFPGGGSSGCREAEIERAEQRRVSGEQRPPESADEFEALLLASPNSSFIWAKYMAYFLSLSQPDKAREVAERSVAPSTVHPTLL